ASPAGRIACAANPASSGSSSGSAVGSRYNRSLTENSPFSASSSAVRVARGSRSIARMRCPWAAMTAMRPPARADLPTPPFSLSMATTGVVVGFHVRVMSPRWWSMRSQAAVGCCRGMGASSLTGGQPSMTPSILSAFPSYFPLTEIHPVRVSHFSHHAGYIASMSAAEGYELVDVTTVDDRRRVVLGKTTATPGGRYAVYVHDNGNVLLVPQTPRSSPE